MTCIPRRLELNKNDEEIYSNRKSINYRGLIFAIEFYAI